MALKLEKRKITKQNNEMPDSNLKTTNMIDNEIKNLTQELIDNGTTYNLEFLENIYDDNLKFLRIDKNNNVQLLTKEDNLKFFKSLKESGAEPLNNYAEFHYADNDGKNGFIVLTRKMKQRDKEEEFLFNIYWKKKKNSWKIVRESVIIK
jgi:hypothetical protein